MRKWLGLGLLGCSWLVACGGRLIDRGSPASAGAFSAGGPAAGAPGAGASQAGGGNGASNGGAHGGVSGQGGAAATCSGDSFVYCATSCGSAAVDYYGEGECVNGSWRCPAPFIDPATCPAEACVLQAVRCCDHEFGKTSVPECGSDGLFGPCPGGFERNANLCVADSAHTTDCRKLQGQGCTLETAMCEAQGAHCQCGPDDGGLLWICAYDVL